MPFELAQHSPNHLKYYFQDNQSPNLAIPKVVFFYAAKNQIINLIN
jgi:hypothetical protein